MDPAVKNPDLKVQEPTPLPTIYESQTEDAFKPTATASEVTEASTGQTTTREASISKTPSSTTTPQAPAAKDQDQAQAQDRAAAQVQAQDKAGKESSVPLLFSLQEKSSSSLEEPAESASACQSPSSSAELLVSLLPRPPPSNPRT